jgi:mercuric ion binding protein
VISVKRSLTKLDGVTKAEVSLQKRKAIVTYDDAKTNVEALLKATKDAGYPSTLKKERK